MSLGQKKKGNLGALLNNVNQGHTKSSRGKLYVNEIIYI